MVCIVLDEKRRKYRAFSFNASFFENIMAIGEEQEDRDSRVFSWESTYLLVRYYRPNVIFLQTKRYTYVDRTFFSIFGLFLRTWQNRSKRLLRLERLQIWPLYRFYFYVNPVGTVSVAWTCSFRLNVERKFDRVHLLRCTFLIGFEIEIKMNVVKSRKF